MKKLLLLAVAALGLTAAAQTSKLSTNLTARLQRPASARQMHRAAAEEAETFRATLISTDVEATLTALEQLGIKGTHIGADILTATLPFAQLDAVAAIPSLKNIELGAPVETKLSRSRQDTKMNIVHNANPKYNALGRSFSGKDVVVGIVDTGFEYGHAAFYDKDGNFRVKRVWDQTAKYGRTPGQFDYGTEYRTQTEILEAKCDNVTAGTHGTHVLGCAAGGDMTVEEYGMAKEADLVIVAVDAVNLATSNVVDGVKYIFDYATSVGKPAVVNLSLGSHYGPHDGTSSCDKAIEAMTGPGRIVVGACGNEGDYKLHISKTFTAEEPSFKTTYGFSSTEYMNNLIDVWGDEGKDYQVQLVIANNLKGQITWQSEPVSSRANQPVTIELTSAQHGVTGYVVLTPKADNSNGRENIYIETHLTSKNGNLNMGLVFSGAPGTTVHAWNCTGNDFVSNNRSGWTEGDTDYTIDEVGGTGRATISVGAYQLRGIFTNVSDEEWVDPAFTGTVGEMGYFSSKGPSLDGRAKPDVSAPGVCICSAVSKLYYGSDYRYSMEALSAGPDNDLYYYFPMTGTSMAAPIVTGIIGCWLEANPTLTPDNIKEILRQTARQDFFTGTALPNNATGYGKIDAYRGLLYAAGRSDLDGISPLTPSALKETLSPAYTLDGRVAGATTKRSLYIQNGEKRVQK